MTPARQTSRPPPTTQQLARTNGTPPPLIPIAPGLMPDAEQIGRIALAVIGDGNLDQMNDDAKTRFVIEASRMLGLNPVMGPFLIVKFEGKAVLYLTKSGAEQLANLHHVSTEVTSKGVEYGLFMTTVRASQGERFADATGAVPFETADGTTVPLVQRGRVIKISETQARRRAILALIGLGFLDRPGMPDPDQMVDRHGNVATRQQRAMPESRATAGEIFFPEDEDEPGLTTARVVGVRPEDVAAAATDDQAGAVSPSGEASAAAAAPAPTLTSTAPAEPDPDDEWEKLKRRPAAEAPRWVGTPLGARVSEIADQLTEARLRFAHPAADASDQDVQAWIDVKEQLLKQRS
jgi:hypothetical protein